MSHHASEKHGWRGIRADAIPEYRDMNAFRGERAGKGARMTRLARDWNLADKFDYDRTGVKRRRGPSRQ
jgi:hypothetical protein